jgi:hypothetical protein
VGAMDRPPSFSRSSIMSSSDRLFSLAPTQLQLQKVNFDHTAKETSTHVSRRVRKERNSPDTVALGESHEVFEHRIQVRGLRVGLEVQSAERHLRVHPAVAICGPSKVR